MEGNSDQNDLDIELAPAVLAGNMSATGAVGLRRMSSIINGLRTVLARSPLNYAAVRYFYLQHACEAVRKVEMPSLSPTMEAGTIVKWHKKEGDPVSPGDVLCDIQTDKAVVAMEYEDEGVLAKIIKPDNSPDIKVGSLIALMVDEGEDWKGVEVPAEAASSSAPSSAPPPAPSAPAGGAPQPAAAAPASLPESVRKIEMPSLSPTMEMGTIVKWHKKEGDVVCPGDVLCDIQTDKAVVAMEYEDEGILAKILKPDNSKDVKVGSLIALIVEDEKDMEGLQVPPELLADPPAKKPAAAATAAPTAGAPPPPPPASAPQPAAVTAAQLDDLHLVGPSVKKIIQEYNIPVAEIKGSGPKGNILKGDVLAYIQQKNLQKGAPAQPGAKMAAMKPGPSAVPSVAIEAPAPSQAPAYIDIPLSNMRKVIAKRLTESKTTIPHAYAAIDCNMTNVVSLRQRMMKDGKKVSVNDFIIKAAGYALDKCPRVNAIWEGDGPKTSPTVDISVAVATEGGLITPIVRSVPELSVSQVSETVRALAEKARAGKLQPEEFQGGSFCISNLGMFGIKEFSAVINLPQVAILAVGGTQQVVGENAVVAPIMTVTLSFDSRAMDEMDATQFLETFRAVLCNPELIMQDNAIAMSCLKSAFAVGKVDHIHDRDREEICD